MRVYPALGVVALVALLLALTRPGGGMAAAETEIRQKRERFNILAAQPALPRRAARHLVRRVVRRRHPVRRCAERACASPGTGFPLGFWFAQQGAIYVFVVLIFVYVALMNRLDREFGGGRGRGGDANSVNVNVQAWTFTLVGLSFALYIGVAIWSRARSTATSTSPAAASRRSPTAWRRPPTGCRRRRSSRWPG
jgi:hypothetical protein